MIGLAKLFPVLTALLLPVVTADAAHPKLILGWGSEVQLVDMRGEYISKDSVDNQRGGYIDTFERSLTPFDSMPLPKFGPATLEIDGLTVGNFKKTAAEPVIQGYVLQQSALFKSPDPFNQKYWTCTFTRINTATVPFAPAQQQDFHFNFEPTAANDWVISEEAVNNGDVIRQCMFGKIGTAFSQMT